MFGTGIARRLAWRIPPVRRVLADRRRLYEENAALRERLAAGTVAGASALPPHLPPSLSEVVNPARYEDLEWLALHRDLERYSMDKHCFQTVTGEVYRKGWEWTHCLYGLRRLGMLTPDSRGVGVGVGRECVIYYLADHVGHVTATDLYGEPGWTATGGKEADLDLLEESKKHCPASVDLSRITFETQDGTSLSYQDDSFDFAWSLSSIEHFGGHAAAARALAEMARVVRPGGILAVATEMMLLEEQRHPEYFAPSEIFSDLIETCGRVELVDTINFDTLGREYLVDAIALPAGVHRRRRHVVLNDGSVQWTSVLLFLRVRHPGGGPPPG